MQSLSMIVLTLLTAIGMVGCDHEKNDKEADKKEIQKIVQSYQEAYNQRNAAKLTAEWASDAIYLNPVTGESATGKANIEKLFEEKFLLNNQKHLEIFIKNIEFPNANEAIEYGIMKVTVNDKTTQQIAYQTVYVKENSKWLIKSISEIELAKPPSNFEQLRDLAWLVGKWKDSDDTIEILFDNQWDKYKNFLTQQFKMQIYGQNDIEGKQLIAWDPVKNSVRSWIFDSDGGFGEGTWKKVDTAWYATMQFTLSDGRTASSINVYTPIDDSSYTFASIEREVDGEILPDLNPVTINKIE